MTGSLLSSWLHAAGQQPAAQAAAIVVSTFILEDVATIVAASGAQEGAVPIPLALGSLYLGIALGDVGLYGLGALSARVRWARRWLPPERMRQARGWTGAHLVKIVLASRFLPGTRLPVYTACCNAG